MLKSKKGFTLIELIVTIAVLGILVLLASPRFFGHTQNAELTKGFANAKSIEKASELYYMDNNDWPRLTDEPYTSEEIESYSERIFNHTGQEINLDPEGNYYDIDYDKLSDYIQVPDDKKNYILQNPVGKVFYMENLNETGKSRVNYNQAINNDEDIIEEQEEKFEFTATFTNAGSTGSTGPSQSQLDNAYAGTILEGLVRSENGIQLWTVPESGTYRVEAYGARGGNSSGDGNFKGGNGAIIAGDFNFKKGEIINILVGQAGGDTINDNTGGGGGTFVYKNPLSHNPLIAAGGGGGSLSSSTSYSRNAGPGINASSTAVVLSRIGGSTHGQANIAGEGAGWGGAGWRSNSTGAQSSAGNAPYVYAPRNGGQGHGNGGFGGGHSTRWTSNAGAGGGYTGGIGAYNTNGARGSGGGSYNSGANQKNLVGNTGHGKVVITYIGE